MASAAGPSPGAADMGLSRWWRVVGGLLMNLALGSLYAWSVFVAPLEKEFGWKRADTSSVFGWAVVVFALSFIVAGRLQDKLGPFKISLVGCILLTVGFLLCARTTSLTYLIVCFGILVGIGNGFGYATPIPVMAKWFPDKRGLAVGLAVAGYGGGSAIFGPMANLWLIPTYGWRTTFVVLGLVFFVMTFVGAMLLKNPPAGYSVPGWVPASKPKALATTHEFTPGETLRTPTFYFMWIAYALGTFGGIHGHQPAGPLRQEHEHPGRGPHGDHARHRRSGQRLRPDSLGLDVRRHGAFERPAPDDRHLGGGHAVALPDRQQRRPCSTSWSLSSTGATARNSP